MKLLVEPSGKNINYLSFCDGLILPLKDFSVQSKIYFSKEEIKEIIINNPTLEIFITINKNFLNEDIDQLKEALLYLDKLDIKGIFFYDIAVLQLKKELNLKVDLVWNQTHMVNNYETCNYYYKKGVNYALLGKEITLEEIKEIIKNSSITPMVEVISIPSVAFSKRKLITNYYKFLGKTPTSELKAKEKVSNQEYLLLEDSNGTSFFLNEIMNGTSIIKELFEMNTPYIVLREWAIDQKLFEEIVKDTYYYVKKDCIDEEYIEKYRQLGTTNFFFKKTIYRVKNNEK